MYEILDNSTGFVGMCGLTDIDLINRRAEFSLYIVPECWKKGYGKAALQTLFSHGFRNLNLNVIWGETFDENPAIELFKNLGMYYEGTRNEFYYRDGSYIDAHLISMSRSQFDNIEKTWSETKILRIK